MLNRSSDAGARARTDSAAVLCEQVALLAQTLTGGANNTIAQVNGTLLSLQHMLESYQNLLNASNVRVVALQDEIAQLKQANVESRRLELDHEARRAELAMKEQRIHALISIAKEIGGVVVAQVLASRAVPSALPGNGPAVNSAVGEARPIEFIFADIWPRLTPETIERLKNEAGQELVFELLMRVTQYADRNIQQQEGTPS